MKAVLEWNDFYVLSSWLGGRQGFSQSSAELGADQKPAADTGEGVQAELWAAGSSGSTGAVLKADLGGAFRCCCHI